MRAFDLEGEPTDLYFLKSFCVAADMRDREDQEHGGPFFIPPSRLAKEETPAYEFLAYEGRTAITPGTQKYSDAHYLATDIPFAKMAIEYFKSISATDPFAQKPPRVPIKANPANSFRGWG